MTKPSLRIHSAGLTDPGKVRQGNEDAFIADDVLGLYAVADGVGGLQAGEEASRAVIKALRDSIAGLRSGTDTTPPYGITHDDQQETRALRHAIVLANQRLWERVRKSPGLQGMGSTVTAMVIRGDQASFAHVGDSRAYRLRGAKLTQLTRDHSLVAEQVRAGKISAADARRSPYRNVITRAVGIEQDIEMDIVNEIVRSGDQYLLCSDGLTDMLPDSDIAGILRDRGPRDAVRALIDAANRSGGKDNITAVVIAAG
jgi:protein phosphatase